ncbi:MAG: hypothetical protein A2W98_08055 [Bacteroidetes bacterium GWF2_33_38]|nr:MAG: hypothetical protein A2W98_08055 [Bacteroidetes bacterium GWF2_33_38]
MVLALVFTLPLFKLLSTYFVAAWIILFFLQKENLHQIRNVFKNEGLILSIIFFFIHLIWLISTQNMKSGLFDIQVKLSLLVFPFLATTVSFNKNQLNRNFVFLFFIFGNFIAQLVSIANVLYEKYILGNEVSFFYNDISLFLHPSYSALYIIISIILGIYLFTTINRRLVKFFLIIYILSSVIFVFLLSSKSGILSLFVIMFIGIALLFAKLNIKKWIKFTTIFTICLLLVSSFFINSRLKHSMSVLKENITNNFLLNPNKYSDSNADRIYIWKSSIELIEQNWLSGVGTGDVKDELLNQYQKNNLTDAYNKKLNAHNQYLETFIGFGLFGFLILFSLFVIPLFYAIKKSNYVLTSFLIIVAFNFLFESMLNTQAGVVFFAFFYNFLAKKEYL